MMRPMIRALIILLALLVLTVGTMGVTSAQTTTVALTGAAAIITPIERVYAAWQPFTNGVMMWWSDTDQIWVMTNNNSQILVYTDQYVEGSPSASFSAPENRTGAVRGFGAIWTALGGGTSSLGWAYAEEIGYDSAARRTGSTPGELIIQGPGNTQYKVTFTLGAQANTSSSNLGTWSVVNIG